MTTMINRNGDGVVRYLELAPELQKIVLEKYFEDNEFVLEEMSYLDQTAIHITKSLVRSSYSILNLLLVSHMFHDQSLAALLHCGNGAHKLHLDDPPDSMICLFRQRLSPSNAPRHLLVDQTIRKMFVDCHSGWKLKLLGARFENVDSVYITACCICAKHTRELMYQHSFSQIASAEMDSAIASCVSRDFGKYILQMGPQAEGVLEKISFYWEEQFGVANRLPANIERNHWAVWRLVDRELVVVTAIRKDNTSVIKKEIRGEKCIYTGQQPELASVADLIEAVKNRDTASMKRLSLPWKRR